MQKVISITTFEGNIVYITDKGVIGRSNSYEDLLDDINKLNKPVKKVVKKTKAGKK